MKKPSTGEDALKPGHKLPKPPPPGFTYPAAVRYTPGPWLLPKLFGQFRASHFILRVLARYKLTSIASLVKPFYIVNERIVEIPFVIRGVADDDRCVLDIGSCWSTVPLELAHLGFKVWAVDQAPYPLTHPNLTVVQADICNLSFPSGFFDVAISLSTLEHVGMGHYKDPLHKDGDLLAIRELWRVLKPGGKLLLTAPFGKASETWQRVYGPVRLERLLSDFAIHTMRYFEKVAEAWLEVSVEEASTIDSPIMETHGVVLVEARKPCPPSLHRDGPS